MAAAAMLNETPKPTDEQIDKQITNICRCGTFQRVRKGIHLASEIKSKGGRS
jgi:isoquinoline 1-oxidoreductase alpha subunit